MIFVFKTFVKTKTQIKKLLIKLSHEYQGTDQTIYYRST